MSNVPSTKQPFAYITHTGESLLVGEIAQEVQARLNGSGMDVSQLAIEAVMRAFRYVTEAISQGDGSVQDDVASRVRGLVRGQRVILSDDTINTILLSLMQTLSASDVAGVTYFSAD